MQNKQLCSSVLLKIYRIVVKDIRRVKLLEIRIIGGCYLSILEVGCNVFCLRKINAKKMC